MPNDLEIKTSSRGINSTNKKALSSYTKSIVFFVISLVVIFPIADACSDPASGFAAMNQGWKIVIVGLFVTIPASIISLSCGLAALKDTKKSYITIIPTGLFLSYILIRLVMIIYYMSTH